MSKKSVRDKLTKNNREEKTVKENKTSENSFFGYTVENSEVDYPKIEIRVNEFDEDSLICLADMLAKMSMKDFVYYLLAYIEQGFMMENKYEEFMFLMVKYEEMIGKNKTQKGDARLCVEPKDLV